MRFVPGAQGGGKKKSSSASQQLKERMLSKVKDLPELTSEEKYKLALQERMDKMMEDYILGKKKAKRSLLNAKSIDEETPKEVPRQTQMLLKMIAMKREARARKEMKMRENKFIKQKKEKAAEALRIFNEQEALRLKQQLELDEARRLAEENGGGGWW